MTDFASTLTLLLLWAGWSAFFALIITLYKRSSKARWDAALGKEK